MDMNAAEPAASVETQLADLPHELLSLCARSSSNKKHLRLVSCGCRAAVDEEVHSLTLHTDSSHTPPFPALHSITLSSAANETRASSALLHLLSTSPCLSSLSLALHQPPPATPHPQEDEAANLSTPSLQQALQRCLTTLRRLWRRHRHTAITPEGNNATTAGAAPSTAEDVSEPSLAPGLLRTLLTALTRCERSTAGPHLSPPSISLSIQPNIMSSLWDLSTQMLPLCPLAFTSPTTLAPPQAAAEGSQTAAAEQGAEESSDAQAISSAATPQAHLLPHSSHSTHSSSIASLVAYGMFPPSSLHKDCVPRNVLLNLHPSITIHNLHALVHLCTLLSSIGSAATGGGRVVLSELRLDLSLSLLNDSSLQSEESLRVIRMMLGAGSATTPLDMLAQALQPIPAHYSASSSVAVSSSNTPTAGARSTALVPSSTPVDDQSQASSSTLAHNASPSPPALSPTTSNVWGWGVFPPHSNSSTSHCSTQTKPTACGLRRLDLNFHSGVDAVSLGPGFGSLTSVLPCLKQLTLKGDGGGLLQIPADDLEPISRLHALQTLTIWVKDFLDEDHLQHLKDLKQLSHLQVARIRVCASPFNLHPLSLPQITTLSFYLSDVSGPPPPTTFDSSSIPPPLLRVFPSLSSATLRDWPLVTDPSVLLPSEAAQQAQPPHHSSFKPQQLQSLLLLQHSHLQLLLLPLQGELYPRTAASMLAIGKLTGLKTITFKHFNSPIHVRDLCSVAAHLPHLHTLTLIAAGDGCKVPRTWRPCNMFSSLTQLRVLSIQQSEACQWNPLEELLMLPLLSHQSGHAPQQHQLQQQTEATQPPSALPTTQQQQTPTIRRSGSSIRNFLGCVGVGSSRHEAAQQPDQQQHRQASSVLRNRGRAGGVRSAPASESGSSSIGESGSGQGQASLKGLQQLATLQLLGKPLTGDTHVTAVQLCDRLPSLKRIEVKKRDKEGGSDSNEELITLPNGKEIQIVHH